MNRRMLSPSARRPRRAARTPGTRASSGAAPTEFTGGAIVGPDGEVGDTARGRPGPWLAFVAPDESAGVLVLDASEAENPWFARSAEYAGLSPAPFFFDETVLAPGETLVLAAAFVIGGADVARFAATAARTSSPNCAPSHCPMTLRAGERHPAKTEPDHR